MRKTDVLKNYTRSLDQSINLLKAIVSLGSPDLTSIDVPKEGEGDKKKGALYNEVKELQWDVLLDEMNFNAQPYTFISYWNHYKAQFDFLFDKFDWKRFADPDFDYMNENEDIFQHYFAHDDAYKYGIVISFINLLVNKVGELKQFFSDYEKFLCDFNQKYSAYKTQNINRKEADAIYDRLLEKKLLDDEEQGRETFIYRLTEKGTDNPDFFPIQLRWKGKTILLYLFLSELIKDEGKIWEKSSYFFLQQDATPFKPDTAKKQIYERKENMKNNPDKEQYKKDINLISYLVTGKSSQAG